MIEPLKDLLLNIIIGIKECGFGCFAAYSIFVFSLFILIDGKMMRAIESILNMKHKVYYYDVLIMILFLFIYVYGIFIFGNYVNNKGA